jgi:hypothetical protein
MNEVYVLTNITETAEAYPELEVYVYSDIVSALTGYGVLIDKARGTAEDFEHAEEEDEVATDNYRWWQIKDSYGCGAITIELQAKEIIEGESDDI